MIELLAPAGNLEILKAAVDSGADAVYCGLSAFNARINATNLTLEEFEEGARYCHHRSSRIYLTLNTLLNDSEIDDGVATALNAYEAGCDGILVQDIGLALEIKKRYPMIPLHCSTQMNVFSDGDLKSLSELGFTRVVLPRELSLQEIAKRSKTAARYKMETEVFAHGAVCVCYSGLCLFSSMNRSGTRSGNRGLCAQPCREEYEITSSDGIIGSGRLLSPKDRDVSSYISGLIESGVASLKIEGRMRDRNYVMSAVRSYRKLIDAYYDGTLDEEFVKSVKNDLLLNFNRGGDYTTQFLSGKKNDGFLSGNFPGKFGLRYGKITATDAKKGTVTFSYDPSNYVPDKGDYISVRKGDKEICSFPVGKVHEMPKSLAVKGLHPDMIEKLENGMNVYLMGHKTVIDRSDLRKTEITLSVDVKDDCMLCNACINDGINSNTYAEYEINLDRDYNGAYLASDRITSQLKKTGDTPFRVSEVYFTGAEQINCPVSAINELRRGVLDNLIMEIDDKYSRAVIEEFCSPSVPEITGTGSFKTMYTYPYVKDDISKVQRGADIYAFSIYELGIKGVRDRIISLIKDYDAELCILLPDMYHDKLEDLIRDVVPKLADALGDRLTAYMDSRIQKGNEILDEAGLKHYLSSGANVHNTGSFVFAGQRCDAVSFSHELTEGEIREILSSSGGKKVILHTEGDICWMQTDHCPVGGNKVRCGKCFEKKNFEMTGRNLEGKVRIVPRSLDCSSAIYGAAKNLFSEDTAREIAGTGFDVIVNKTFV